MKPSQDGLDCKKSKTCNKKWGGLGCVKIYKLVTVNKRREHLKKLKDGSTEYDVLIIGGGANGAGVVLDAASRGLKCAVVDSFDFAAGTSSKSTKMAHGGIRYF